MRLYTISGLGADRRVFKYLNLSKTEHLDWIEPQKNETLKVTPFDFLRRLTPPSHLR